MADLEASLAHLPRPRAYVAGPMRGYSQCNFPAFDEAAAALRGLGWDPVSPADHDRETGFDPLRLVGCSDGELLAEGFDLSEALRWDLGVIMDRTTKAIVLLPGWQESRGVTLELAVARAMGLEVWYYADGDIHPEPGQ